MASFLLFLVIVSIIFEYSYDLTSLSVFTERLPLNPSSQNHKESDCFDPACLLVSLPGFFNPAFISCSSVSTNPC